ncbi:alpha/beta fold hydrolase [uncultured Roseobacter sp.]|uniref:alpha/beta fold hydrolase n=1 Tax=uncultured Roseobacter sp. TaxID=114847 RepID=UPI00262A49BC|nr:alpha/beta fold hydrolase [uncultured Roseobacter sp.]
MTLFLSRRAYDTRSNCFTANPSQNTYYVAPPDTGPVTRQHILSRADWLSRVKAEARSGEITLFVHGYNTEQSEMRSRAALIDRNLRSCGYRGALIAFDWPSAGRSTLSAYRRDRRAVKKTAPSLVADGILPLLDLRPRPRINLIAHSMGAYATLRGLSAFNDASGPRGRAWRLDEILFVSGDADQDWLSKGAWGSLLLAHRCRRFTNYFSQLDEILNGAVVLNGGAKRVGRSGIKPLIHRSHVDVYSHEQYLKNTTVRQRTALYSHRWWFENAAFYRDASLTLAGADAHAMPTRQRMNTTDLALLS